MKTTLKMLSISGFGIGVILATSVQGTKWDSEINYLCTETICADDSASATLAKVERVDKGWQDVGAPAPEASETFRVQQAIKGEIPCEVTATLETDIDWED